MRIIDRINEHIAAGEPFFSFEYFPPKTDAGLNNLYGRMDRMIDLGPTFVDVTWGAGGSTSDQTLAISATAQEFFGIDVLMHLTCTNMTVDRLDAALDAAYAAGIRNILALRGDAPQGAAAWERVEGGFSYAYQLVEHIRARFGDSMCVGVAGYPEGHLEAADRESCTDYLKHKVDCGADFVITQLLFDVDEYLAFLGRCERRGIDCPVIPGMLPIQNYSRFKKMATFTKVSVPDSVAAALEPIKQDDAQVREYGVDLCVEMSRRLLEYGAPGLHFYTLNLEWSVARIVDALGLRADDVAERSLPWRSTDDPSRGGEDVRPIFWSNRPESYLARTANWDDFPNGRWGDRRSPSYGTLNEYYLMRRGIRLAARDAVEQVYGEPEWVEDVFQVFARFCAGEIDSLPWVDGGLQGETQLISHELVALNANGYLTINSQPQVNGVASSHPELGWGGAGGVCYQKAYIEMFLSPERLQRFLAIVAEFPSLTYQAVNVAGDAQFNVPPNSVNAVTWGIFPGKEIIQPTVVEFQSFMIWKEEAFAIWKQQWGDFYETGSRARAVLDEIHDSYYLLNIVENDFIRGDLFAAFRRLDALEHDTATAVADSSA